MKTLFLGIIACMLLCAPGLRAQSSYIGKITPLSYAQPSTGNSGQQFVHPINSFSHTTEPLPIKSNLYTQHLGYFCRQELKLEQQVKFPVKIRLGSTDYTNWLEQKAGASMPSR